MNPRQRQQREIDARAEHLQALNRRKARIAEKKRRKRKSRVAACGIVMCIVVASAGIAFAANSVAHSPTSGPEKMENATKSESAEGQSDSEANAESKENTSVSTTSGSEQAREVLSTLTDERARQMALDPSNNSNWRLETDGSKKVYLTFDDGPSQNTERILDILAKNDVKATFFVTGHSPDKFDLIKKEWEAGHSVGMHSYSHNYSEIYASIAAYKADLDKIGNVIKEQIGFVPFLFRFPGGASNVVSAKYCQGIMTELTSELVAEGYQYFDWSISSGDAASDDVATSEIVTNSCQEGWTNITLLMHDTDAKNTTVDALGDIIKFYKERGYTFCAIDRSSYAVHHAVGN